MKIIQIISWIEQHAPFFNATSAALVTAFTLALVIVSTRQASLTRKAANAAQLSAVAAKESADALPNLERAYVFIDGEIRHDIRTFQQDETTYPLAFNVCFTLRNYGKSPAILTEGVIQAATRYIADRDPSRLALPETTIRPELVISSGDAKEIGTILVISSEEYFAAVDGVGRIFLVGIVPYEDVFGRSHETRFCFEFDAVLGRWHISNPPMNSRT